MDAGETQGDMEDLGKLSLLFMCFSEQRELGRFSSVFIQTALSTVQVEILILIV